MSVRVMGAVWDTDLPPSEKLVLLALADCANDEGHCWPSASTIAKKSGQGERTVRRAIRSLEKAGHLTQRQRNGTSAVYSIHPCQSGTPANLAPLPQRPETPATAAPKPSRTIKASETKVSKAKPNSKKSAFILPDDIPAEPWAGFEGMRNRIGKPMTDYARTLAVNELRKLRDEVGWPPGQVLNHCTMNSYQGIYPPKRERQNGRQQHHPDLGKSGLAFAMQGSLSDDRPM